MRDRLDSICIFSRRTRHEGVCRPHLRQDVFSAHAENCIMPMNRDGTAPILKFRVGTPARELRLFLFAMTVRFRRDAMPKEKKKKHRFALLETRIAGKSTDNYMRSERRSLVTAGIIAVSHQGETSCPRLSELVAILRNIQISRDYLRSSTLDVTRLRTYEETLFERLQTASLTERAPCYYNFVTGAYARVCSCIPCCPDNPRLSCTKIPKGRLKENLRDL